ncbi:sensor histidine kinase [Nonomuraea aurantiaca]|uniref:sensor histidine kinase n=1 Tax=Nonomuraea aurantiaca TaxID=2878562 RepID=UPI001CDA11AC|nr:sensor histidine kinase [Nonomuraea aurantiaca]MCA2223610.1 sensor histidine kinase [Nonomuraea aurantiaca]
MAPTPTPPPDPGGTPQEAPDAPGIRAFLTFVLLAAGAIWETVDGSLRPGWLSWTGLAAMSALYTLTVVMAFRRRAVPARLALAGLAAVVFGWAIVLGHGWYYLFPLLGVACGVTLRGRAVRVATAALPLGTALVVWAGGGTLESILAFSWGTLSAGLVVAVILHLHMVIGELNQTRQRLAEAAVAEERLRFSRDLHDLLGHTLSVIVVKAEAVRRLARRDPGQAERQAADIEAVGRQALTEVREAVTGYRAGGLADELSRARDALAAAGVRARIRRTGPPPAARAETLLGWVVREGVTNIIRHSGATEAEIDLTGLTLTIRDNGSDGPHPTESGTGGAGESGSGLRGLAERLGQAGGSVEAGPHPGGGFQLTATLPPGV